MANFDAEVITENCELGFGDLLGNRAYAAICDYQQSMHLGVLATASHAITTQTLFLVYYKPRFIVSLSHPLPLPYVLYGYQFSQYVVALVF